MDFGLIAAAAPGVTSLLTGAANTYLGFKNFGLQKSQFDYQRDLQERMFGREDTSITRRVADLKNAGLSPVLAAGQGAGSGPVVSTNAPQYPALPDLTGAVLSALKMRQDISTTAAQEKLLHLQATQTAGNTLKTLSEIDNVDADTIKKKIESGILGMDSEIQRKTGTTSKKTGFTGTYKDIVGALDTSAERFKQAGKQGWNSYDRWVGERTKNVQDWWNKKGDKK